MQRNRTAEAYSEVAREDATVCEHRTGFVDCVIAVVVLAVPAQLLCVGVRRWRGVVAVRVIERVALELTLGAELSRGVRVTESVPVEVYVPSVREAIVCIAVAVVVPPVAHFCAARVVPRLVVVAVAAAPREPLTCEVPACEAQRERVTEPVPICVHIPRQLAGSVRSIHLAVAVVVDVVTDFRPPWILQTPACEGVVVAVVPGGRPARRRRALHAKVGGQRVFAPVAIAVRIAHDFHLDALIDQAVAAVVDAVADLGVTGECSRLDVVAVAIRGGVRLGPRAHTNGTS